MLCGKDPGKICGKMAIFNGLKTDLATRDTVWKEELEPFLAHAQTYFEDGMVDLLQSFIDARQEDRPPPGRSPKRSRSV
jgi:hypothetical protein